MAERQLPKLHTRVRFPSPAPYPARRRTAGCAGRSWRPSLLSVAALAQHPQPMSAPIQVLFQGPSPPDLATSALGPFVVQACGGLDDAAEQLRLSRYDAMLVQAGTAGDVQALMHWHALPHAALDTALIVQTPEPTAADLTRLL